MDGVRTEAGGDSVMPHGNSSRASPTLAQARVLMAALFLLYCMEVMGG